MREQPRYYQVGTRVVDLNTDYEYLCQSEKCAIDLCSKLNEWYALISR